MTKTKEIELLDKTIKRFGPNSYIGPWLSILRDGIVKAIEQDLPVEIGIWEY